MKPTKNTARKTKISPKEIYNNIKRVWLEKWWAKEDDPDLDEKISETVKAVIEKGQEWFWTDEWREPVIVGAGLVPAQKGKAWGVC